VNAVGEDVGHIIKPEMTRDLEFWIDVVGQLGRLVMGDTAKLCKRHAGCTVDRVNHL
ncbi:uncharacterized protein METZ01_LOCUS406530, partial [marine metagenome]